MPSAAKILNEDQIINHHATLEIALPRLKSEYVGKMMQVHKTTSGNGQLHKIISFRIVPIDADDQHIPDVHTLYDILQQKGIADLAIMVVYADHTGEENIAHVNHFLSANDIKRL